jgi:hypothetical protein
LRPDARTGALARGLQVSQGFHQERSWANTQKLQGDTTFNFHTLAGAQDGLDRLLAGAVCRFTGMLQIIHAVFASASHREMNNLRFGHRSLHLLPLGRNHHAAAPFFISVFKGQSFLFLLKLLRAITRALILSADHPVVGVICFSSSNKVPAPGVFVLSRSSGLS